MWQDDTVTLNKSCQLLPMSKVVPSLQRTKSSIVHPIMHLSAVS